MCVRSRELSPLPCCFWGSGPVLAPFRYERGSRSPPTADQVSHPNGGELWKVAFGTDGGETRSSTTTALSCRWGCNDCLLQATWVFIYCAPAQATWNPSIVRMCPDTPLIRLRVAHPHSHGNACAARLTFPRLTTFNYVKLH